MRTCIIDGKLCSCFLCVPTGLRMMINALLSSVVQLLEVMALTLFCLMIFALFALEVYMGKLRQKCVVIKGGPLDPNNIPIHPNDPLRDKLWSE